MLRKHQKLTMDTINGIIAGNSANTILLKATPGAGKSAIAPIASRLIDAGLADSICWVCPRKSLQSQGERNFLDPFFRDLLGHTATVRAATNDPDPCRGHAGFITTYQAIGVDQAETVLNDFKRKRYILVLDEFHHCEADGTWAKAIQPLFDLAAFRVLMTGTIQRGDDSQIAFIDYDSIIGGFTPVLEDTETTRVIEYTRTDALMERAILPLKFHLHDGVSEWIDEQGQTRRESLGKVLPMDAGAAIYTALKTEYANELLELAYSHWLKHQYDYQGAKLLIVTSSLEHAQAAAEFLKKKHHPFGTATSHDSAKAHEMIKQFKGRYLNILITIAMAYEGLDVPAVSHVACLTHIRSLPWIEQMVGRAVRINPAFTYESQTGFIFAPDDPFFRKIVKQIEAEQAPVAKKEGVQDGDQTGGRRGKQLSLFGDQSGADNRYRIIPVGSKLTGQRELPLGGHIASAAPSTEATNSIKTPSEIEAELREAIDDHVKRYAFSNRHTPKKINAEIKKEFGKVREEMNGNELQAAMDHVLKFYPLNRVRGTGIPRRPTKAVAWP